MLDKNINKTNLQRATVQGRIDGVIKKGKTWLIPRNSKKPMDARKVCHNNKRGVLGC